MILMLIKLSQALEKDLSNSFFKSDHSLET